MNSKNREFTAMEIDALGEILNISMGAAATAVSLLLDTKVSITTPEVVIYPTGEYEFTALKPAVGIEINYIEGITGTNVMILKREDVMHIVGALLGQEFTEETFVMDEMNTSAICEVMNQMMGSSSMALSDFLNRNVNISTPISFEIDSDEVFKKKYLDSEGQVVSVKFNLIIEGFTNSEFACVLPTELAEELLALFLTDLNPAAAPAAPQVPEMPVEPAPAPVFEMPVEPIAEPSPAPIMTPIPNQAPVAPPAPAPAPRPQRRTTTFAQAQEVAPVQMNTFSHVVFPDGEQSDNLKLIMSVPLQITAELGRTKRTIKEILELTTGSVVELGTQAGTPVDILVNNQSIAKGDVVVVGDFYGVRITEILNPNEIMQTL